ncbi:uncharacterized protein LOC131497230 [Neofelis nebulosa]|uniref:uncharacterized protein LOC131497230 n=1 Tax=Neofelis nebulosa TaxID=61452 RepID=UPI002729C4A8|nr:uncharacterized protein LOC131497230 [Neofelis nebulosa]
MEKFETFGRARPREKTRKSGRMPNVFRNDLMALSLHRNSGLRQSDEKSAAVKQICLVYLAQTIKRHQYLSPPSGGSKVPSWLRRSGRAWGPQWPSSTQGEPVEGCPAPVLPGPVHQARNEPNLLSETCNTHMLCFSRNPPLSVYQSLISLSARQAASGRSGLYLHVCSTNRAQCWGTVVKDQSPANPEKPLHKATFYTAMINAADGRWPLPLSLSSLGWRRAERSFPAYITSSAFLALPF